MRGFLRPLDGAFATGSAIACAAAAFVGAFAGVLAVPLGAPFAAAYAQGASGSAAPAPARQKETAMLHWGTTVVWFRATAADSVLVFASPGFRNPFAHPIAVSADDIDRWAEFAQRLVVLSGSASAVSPSLPAAAAPETAHMILGAGDVMLETTSDEDGMALRVNIGANRQDGQTAMLFADGAPAAAAALHDAARTARTLHVAAVAQAQTEAQAAAAAAQTAAQQAAQSPPAFAPATSPPQSAPPARGVTAVSAHATTRGMKPVVVSATSVPVNAGPGPAGVDDVTVQNLVHQWQPELLYCYTEYGLRSHPGLTGTAMVRVALAQDGSVGYAGIVQHAWSGEGWADVENCIRTKVNTWRFPPAAAASVHELPLNFSR
jgi:hypothetical protein